MIQSKKDVAIKILLELARVILGVTFVFSGFVKAVDPLGTAYKIQDYLIFLHLQWMHQIAAPMAIGLCSLEFLLGVWLLLGVYRRVVTKLLFVIMMFMTPLTLYLALKNPVHDCGCFGDFWVITNWETFFKNLILLPCSVIVMIWATKISPLFSRHTYWLAALSTFGFIISFTVYSYWFIPIFDFRPYKIGTDLRKLVNEKPKGAEYINTFVYEKNGEKRNFTEDNYPWQDTTWHFVSTKSIIKKAAKTTGVEDFSVTHLKFSADKKQIVDQVDMTDSLLNDSSYTFLMLAYSLKDMSKAHVSGFEDISYYAQENGYKFYCLTASSQQEILNWVDETGVNYDFCWTDERVLKTMDRSNPGLMLMKNGKIINKWPDSRIPTEDKLNKPLSGLSFSKIKDINRMNKEKFLILCIIFVSPLIVLQMIDLVAYKTPKRKKLNIKLEKHPEEEKE